MLDDLRRSTEDDFSFDDDEEDAELLIEEEAERRDQLFLGMTAVERMMLSIFFFMNVTILTLAFLLATRRIVF
jgi:hypothetical protein